MKVMLDTNVLISLFLFRSVSADRLVGALAHDRVILCTYVLDELQDVVERKFPTKGNDVKRFLDSLPYEAVETPSKSDMAVMGLPHMRDELDLPVLASAIAGDVDVLVTGDRDFEPLAIARPLILTPAEYTSMAEN